MNQYVVPMYESEAGWGSKIDGYAGPFQTYDSALDFAKRYNQKYNSAKVTPSWYIKALQPEAYMGQKCDYKSVV